MKIENVYKMIDWLVQHGVDINAQVKIEICVKIKDFVNFNLF